MVRLRAIRRKPVTHGAKSVVALPLALTRAEEVIRQSRRRIEATQELLIKAEECLSDKRGAGS